MEETKSGSSQQCVAGEQGAAAQADTWEAQAGDQENPFPYDASSAVEPGLREVSQPMAEPVAVPASMSTSAIVWNRAEIYLLVETMQTSRFGHLLSPNGQTFFGLSTSTDSTNM